MKVGDLVRWSSNYTKKLLPNESHGIVVYVDDSHRQISVDVLFAEGVVSRIWKNHLEVIDE